MPTRLDIVDRLHRRLLEIVANALPLITSSFADADLPGLTHLREELIEVIAAYQRHADHAHAAATAANDPAASAATHALRLSCSQLTQAYEEFRARWAHRHAVGHWAEYRLSAIRMMKLIRNHVLAAERFRAGVGIENAA